MTAGRGLAFFGDTPQDVAEKLLEPTNRNSIFIQRAIGERYLNPSALNAVPPSVSRTLGQNPRTGSTPLGRGARSNASGHLVTDLPTGLDQNRRLTRDISVGTFMGPPNRGRSLRGVTNRDEIIPNLYLHAEILQAARSRSEFQRRRIMVYQGVYIYDSVETRTTGSIADLSSRGRAIGYRVYNHEGQEDRRGVYDLAEYLIDYPFYDKLVLYYDTYLSSDPTATLFVITPDISQDYENATFSRELETQFNGITQSSQLIVLGE